MGEAAEDDEMRLAFNAAFAELDCQYVSIASGIPAGDAVANACAGESFAARLASAVEAEVQEQRRQRRLHIDQYLAQETPVRQPSVCAAPPPVALAVTPPRATAMA